MVAADGICSWWWHSVQCNNASCIVSRCFWVPSNRLVEKFTKKHTILNGWVGSTRIQEVVTVSHHGFLMDLIFFALMDLRLNPAPAVLMTPLCIRVTRALPASALFPLCGSGALSVPAVLTFPLLTSSCLLCLSQPYSNRHWTIFLKLTHHSFTLLLYPLSHIPQLLWSSYIPPPCLFVNFLLPSCQNLACTVG